MPSTVVPFLASRPDAAAFLLPSALETAVNELFAQPDILPQP